MLNEKTVLIIGGTSGFGYTAAELAAQKGAHVLITGRSPQKLENAVKSLKASGPNAEGYLLDTADEDSMADFFLNIGKFDHLISTLGSFMGGGFLSAPLETIQRVIAEKFLADLKIARLAAPHLQKQGSIVLTGGSGGRPDTASGAIIANSAIKTMVQGLAVELAPNVRVNAVAPTWTRTDLWRNTPAQEVNETEEYFNKTIPLGRTATVEEVAMTYIFLLENSFITGQTITVDGGLTLVS